MKKQEKNSQSSGDVHLTPFYRSHGAEAHFSNGSDEHTHGLDYGAQLWTRLHGPRLLAAGLIFGSLTLAIVFVWRAF